MNNHQEFINLINSKGFEFSYANLSSYQVEKFCNHFLEKDINITNHKGWNLFMIYLSIQEPIQSKIKLTNEQWNKAFENIDIQHRTKDGINILQILVSSYKKYKNNFSKTWLTKIEKEIQLTDEEWLNLIPLYFENHHKLQLSNQQIKELIHKIINQKSNEKISEIFYYGKIRKVNLSEENYWELIKKINFENRNNDFNQSILKTIFTHNQLPNKEQIYYILDKIKDKPLQESEYGIFNIIYGQREKLGFQKEEINQIFSIFEKNIEQVFKFDLNYELKDYLLYEKRITVSDNIQEFLWSKNKKLATEIYQNKLSKTLHQSNEHPKSHKI
jgi:hypothetical protein